MSKQSATAQTWQQRIKGRLQTDFQFAMIVAFGILASVAILGFAIFRFLTGNWIGTLVNLGIMLMVVGVMLYAVLSGRSRRAGALFALVTAMGVLSSALAMGQTALMWSYLVFWINFVLADRRWALLVNIALLLTLVANQQLFDSGTEVVTYLITAVLSSAFGFIFAYRLAYQQEQLELMASRDPLTEAGNRRSMRRELLAAVSDHARTARPYTLMLLDLDHFKALNDAHGHDAGDQALRDFADLLRSHIRSGDSLYRFGGEEFVLLFPNTGAEAAERLVRTLHENTNGRLAGPAGQIHFSAGVAMLEKGDGMDDWIRRADRALYRAKESGRGRVEISAAARTARC